MTKYTDVYNTNHVLEIDGTDYLVQGKVNDPITMFRTVDNLLECERDNVQKLLGELE